MNRAAEPYRKVSQIVNAFAASRVLHVASGLDLFTAMANQGKTSAQLARRSRTRTCCAPVPATSVTSRPESR